MKKGEQRIKKNESRTKRYRKAEPTATNKSESFTRSVNEASKTKQMAVCACVLAGLKKRGERSLGHVVPREETDDKGKGK